ncbi:MAG: SDR family oxidoreductase [Alphaproteobacteria bacterium]|nr:SDR family oxidoreductase [Alphaproteobacteria bacterium]
MMKADLSGKAALVTGGASGIGLATVERLAGCGARVAMNHLPDDPAGAREIARLRAQGLDVVGAPGDVADANAASGIVGAVVAALGRLDYLVNNAGTPVSRDPVPFTDLDKLDEDFWGRILQTNLVGLFRCVRAAAPHLKASRGAVVNLASIAGFGGVGSSLAYAASKAGVVNLTRNLAIALAPEIRVNAVAPGLVDTPWTKPWADQRKRASVERTALKRMATPQDIADVILFFCAGADFVTGQTLLCDGGRATSA